MNLKGEIALNNRCISILYQLITHKEFTTAKELAAEFNVSERTIRYDLDELDYFLESNSLPLLERKSNAGIRYKLNAVNSEKVKSITSNLNYAYYNISKEERINIILKELFNSNDYITIDELALKVSSSRGTVVNDLKYAKTWLKQRNIILNSSKYKGICIEGNEINIRKAIVEINKNSLKKLNRNVTLDYEDFKVISSLFSKEDISLINTCISEAENNLGIVFSDNSYVNLTIHLGFALKRIRQGNYINSSEVGHFKELVNTKEYKIAEKILTNIEKKLDMKIKDEEIGYVALYLVSSSIAPLEGNDDINDNWVNIQLIVGELINSIQEDMGISLIDDEKLYYGLINHLRPAIYRIKNHMILENPLIEEIKKDYKDIFLIIERNINILERYINKKVNSHEIGYIALHFAASIKRKRKNNIYKPNVLLVCNSGIGTSQILSEAISSRFNVNIIDIISARQLMRSLKSKDIDLVISTVPIENIDIKCITVNPILTKENVSEIQQSIYETNYSRSKDIENILEDLKESPSASRDSYENNLTRTSHVKPMKIYKGGYEPMLKEVLTEDSIEVNVEADNWEEAVRKGGALLLKSDVIEERYIEEMINNVKVNGSYIVIAPGIAMPHARPECGAKGIGFSLITLKNPVPFGNPVNDPVKLMISLCAVDHNTHLKALSELMGILMDEEKVSKIINSNDKHTVLELINS